MTTTLRASVRIVSATLETDPPIETRDEAGTRNRADEIGRLDWMSLDSQAKILARIDGREQFDLAVNYFLGMPCWKQAGDPEYQIWMSHTPQGSINDNLTGAGPEAHKRDSYAGSAISMYSHTGTHLCGLNHIGRDGVFWNGWNEKEHLGSRNWKVGGVVPPIIARGVLLDIASDKNVDCLPDSYAITPKDIEAGYRRSRVEPRKGDVVLIRTGRMSRWPDPKGFLENPPGLGMDAARLICDDLEAMCLGLDVGGEVLPPEEPDTFLPVHSYLLSEAGTPLIENMWLEELSRSKTTEFALLAFPLKLEGSTGMPVRPVALPVTPKKEM